MDLLKELLKSEFTLPNGKVWMARNLGSWGTRRYSLPNIHGYPPGGKNSNVMYGGRLYTYYDLCPEKGWHLPSLDDWKELIEHFGNESILTWPGFNACCTGYYNSMHHDYSRCGVDMRLGDAMFWTYTEKTSKNVKGELLKINENRCIEFADSGGWHISIPDNKDGYSVRYVKY